MESSFKTVAFLKSSSYHFSEIMMLPAYNLHGRACLSHSFTHLVWCNPPVSTFKTLRQLHKNWAVQQHTPTVCRARKVQSILTLHKHSDDLSLYRLCIKGFVLPFFSHGVQTCTDTKINSSPLTKTILEVAVSTTSTNLILKTGCTEVILTKSPLADVCSGGFLKNKLGVVS